MAPPKVVHVQCSESKHLMTGGILRTLISAAPFNHSHLTLRDIKLFEALNSSLPWWLKVWTWGTEPQLYHIPATKFLHLCVQSVSSSVNGDNSKNFLIGLLRFKWVNICKMSNRAWLIENTILVFFFYYYFLSPHLFFLLRNLSHSGLPLLCLASFSSYLKDGKAFPDQAQMGLFPPPLGPLVSGQPSCTGGCLWTAHPCQQEWGGIWVSLFRP